MKIVRKSIRIPACMGEWFLEKKLITIRYRETRDDVSEFLSYVQVRKVRKSPPQEEFFKLIDKGKEGLTLTQEKTS